MYKFLHKFTYIALHLPAACRIYFAGADGLVFFPWTCRLIYSTIHLRHEVKSHWNREFPHNFVTDKSIILIVNG